MKKRYALASVFTGVAALAAWAIPAGAAPTREAFGGAKSAVLGNVRIDPNNDQIAYVTAQYVCPAEPGPAALWVSVKQMASTRPNNALKQPESSGASNAWLQEHPDPSSINCDGAWHTATYQVDTLEFNPFFGGNVGFGHLVPGQVYVQFCLTGPGGDDVNPPAWAGLDQRFTVAS